MRFLPTGAFATRHLIPILCLISRAIRERVFCWQATILVVALHANMPLGPHDYGFRCLIAPSFADIFYNNCFNNSILPVTLDEAIVQELMAEVEALEGYTLHIDLAAQTVTTSAQRHTF